MKYFRNTELAKLYNVSEKSVRNWIQAAKDGKLDLELSTSNGKSYIANITKNTTLIEDLIQKGKKYRNSRGLKYISPTAEFYKRYGTKQIYDIISSIDIHREIPHQYSYFNGGARHWDAYTQKLLDEKAPNLLTDTIELLDLNIAYLDKALEDYSSVNIIDIGVGNCLPVRDLLTHLLAAGKLKRYIGIDTSSYMLKIAQRNIDEWFGDKIHFEGYVKDINYDRFDDVLAADSFNKDKATINLVLFLGATILNFREPDLALRVIHNSMGKNDLLLFSLKLDTEQARRYFDFAAGSGAPALDLKEKTILDLLNIDESLYTVEQFYDEKHRERRIQVRFKVAMSIEFMINGQPKVVELNKDTAILLWRAKHQSIIDTIQKFDESGFEILQATRSKDRECLLSTSAIKSNI